MCGLTGRQPRASAAACEQVVDRLPCHGCAALGDEQPRQLIASGGEIALVARNSSPAIGCSTDSPFLSRRTHSREAARSTSSGAGLWPRSPAARAGTS